MLAAPIQDSESGNIVRRPLDMCIVSIYMFSISSGSVNERTGGKGI